MDVSVTQVAGQQGSFLVAEFNSEVRLDKGFWYFHKGSMAYIGQDKAVAQVRMLKSFLPNFWQEKILQLGKDIVLTGSRAEIVRMFLYFDMQISNQNKLQFFFDWMKVILFGRNTSRF